MSSLLERLRPDAAYELYLMDRVGPYIYFDFLFDGPEHFGNTPEEVFTAHFGLDPDDALPHFEDVLEEDQDLAVFMERRFRRLEEEALDELLDWFETERGFDEAPSDEGTSLTPTTPELAILQADRRQYIKASIPQQLCENPDWRNGYPIVFQLLAKDEQDELVLEAASQWEVQLIHAMFTGAEDRLKAKE